jgi:hypothetical protein
MISFENWYNSNMKVLKHLYETLVKICSLHDIQLIKNNESFNNFLYMMYNESTKEILDKNLYPEYFI